MTPEQQGSIWPWVIVAAAAWFVWFFLAFWIPQVRAMATRARIRRRHRRLIMAEVEYDTAPGCFLWGLPVYVVPWLDANQTIRAEGKLYVSQQIWAELEREAK